jgi:predicted  nucleic acid-binding Zn-ribbon protein
MQLTVLGMHRSGTSVLARLLNMMGVYFGPEGSGTGANAENPKGFWERRDVRDLNDALLHAAGCDWDRLSGFSIDRIPEAELAAFDRQASALLLEMDAHRPWFIKEPRLCVLLPCWRRHFELPVAVHIVRHPLEVAASLAGRNRMPTEVGLALWELYVRSALAATMDMPSIVVSHQRLMVDPVAETQGLFECLQALQIPALRMPTAREITAFIDPALYRARLPSVESSIGERERALYSAILDRPFDPALGRAPLPEQALAALADYESQLPPLIAPPPEQPGFDIATATPRGLFVEMGRLRERSQAMERQLTRLRERERNLAENDKQARRECVELQQRLEALEQALQAAADTERSLRVAIADRDLQIDRGVRAHRETRRIAEERSGEIAELTRLLLKAEREEQQLRKSLEACEREVATLSGDVVSIRAQAEEMQAALRRRIAEEARLRMQSAEEMQAALRRQMAEAARREDKSAVELYRCRSESARLREDLRLLNSYLLVRVMQWFARGWRRLRGKPVSRLAAEVADLRRSELFDADWYLQTYRDVSQDAADPAEHYLLHGAAEGRNPGPLFDTRFYLKTHADVRESGANPLLHFVRYGKREGRKVQGVGTTADGGRA